MKNLILFFLLAISTQAIGQVDESKTEYKGALDYFTIGIGTGFSSFIGDIATDSKVSMLSNTRSCHSLNLEHRFGAIAGAQIDLLYGSLAYNENSNVIVNNRNFQSPLLQIGINFVFHMDDDLIFKRNSPFSPYLSAGISYLTFDANSDLQDKNGNYYHYWENGTINDIAYTNTGMDTNATQLTRDFTYESQLTDSTENYKRNAFSIPLTIGLKWKFSKRIQGRVFGSYNVALTDRIDNYKENGNNDKFIYAGFSLHYVVGRKDQELKHRYDDVDFAALKKGDDDGDGIIDTKDECQHTPKGVEVDAYGCPMDEDNDGVPDYEDQEKGTKDGAQVDEMGRELTDDILAARFSSRDSIKTVRHESFSDDASMATLVEISNQIAQKKANKDDSTSGSGIPENLQEADSNLNGIISAGEIADAIDGFFEGSNNFTVKALHELINYFFEQ